MNSNEQEKDGNINENSAGSIIDEVVGDEEITIPDETEELRKENEALKKELKEKNEEMLRRAADTDNYRKRLEKEKGDAVKYANQQLIKDFIPVLDNLELALQHTEEGSPFRTGTEITIKSFKDALFKYGIKEISAEIGAPFNPAFHEALMMDNNEEYENNAITLVIQKGYTINDRVIRAAKVKVNKK